MGGLARFLGPVLSSVGAGMVEQAKATEALRQREALMRENAEIIARRDRALQQARLAEPFTIGRERLQYNPDTGETATLYRGKADAELYAESLGLKPDSPEYETALKDFVLKGNGPTAHGFDEDLDDHRTSNRSKLETQRQANREALRGTPTYRDTHPREEPARSGGSSAPSGLKRTSRPGRPAAIGPNGERIEWDGSKWVPIR